MCVHSALQNLLHNIMSSTGSDIGMTLVNSSSTDELRFYRICKLLLDIMSPALRKVFVLKWDELYSSTLKKRWSELDPTTRGKYLVGDDNLESVQVAEIADATVEEVVKATVKVETPGNLDLSASYFDTGDYISFISPLDNITRHFKLSKAPSRLSQYRGKPWCGFLINLKVDVKDVKHGWKVGQHRFGYYAPKNDKLKQIALTGDDSKYDYTVLYDLLCGSESHHRFLKRGEDGDKDRSFIKALKDQRNKSFAHLELCRISENDYNAALNVCRKFMQHFFSNNSEYLDELTRQVSELGSLEVFDTDSLLGQIRNELSAALVMNLAETRLVRSELVSGFVDVADRIGRVEDLVTDVTRGNCVSYEFDILLPGWRLDAAWLTPIYMFPVNKDMLERISKEEWRDFKNEIVALCSSFRENNWLSVRIGTFERHSFCILLLGTVVGFVIGEDAGKIAFGCFITAMLLILVIHRRAEEALDKLLAGCISRFNRQLFVPVGMLVCFNFACFVRLLLNIDH